MPAEIVSDRDKLFTSNFWRALCTTWGIRQAMSTAYHPQTDGQTERVNRVLEDTLRHYVNTSQDDWDVYLPCAEFAINNAKHEALGQSPFKLTYGIDPRSPATAGLLKASDSHIVMAMYQRIAPTEDLIPAAHKFTANMQRCMKHVKWCLESAQQRAKALADAKRSTDVPFTVGQPVLLKVGHLNLKQMGCRKLAAQGHWAIQHLCGCRACSLQAGTAG